MFRRATNPQNTVTITFDGQSIQAEEGETVAAALLSAGISVFRHAAEDDSRRGPYCMIGNCFECLIDVEGSGSRQACRERVHAGTTIRRHPGLYDLESGS